MEVFLVTAVLVVAGCGNGDAQGDDARASYILLGDGFRWVTVGHPSQLELEITFMLPGPPLDDEMADAVRHALDKGKMGGIGLHTDDCHKT